MIMLEQKIFELEKELKALEEQNDFLKRKINQAGKKIIIFDMMINIAEKEFNIPIRKKTFTKVVEKYREKYKESLMATCSLLGKDRQLYYKSKRSKNIKNTNSQ